MVEMSGVYSLFIDPVLVFNVKKNLENTIKQYIWQVPSKIRRVQTIVSTTVTSEVSSRGCLAQNCKGQPLAVLSCTALYSQNLGGMSVLNIPIYWTPGSTRKVRLRKSRYFNPAINTQP